MALEGTLKRRRIIIVTDRNLPLLRERKGLKLGTIRELLQKPSMTGLWGRTGICYDGDSDDDEDDDEIDFHSSARQTVCCTMIIAHTRERERRKARKFVTLFACLVSAM